MSVYSVKEPLFFWHLIAKLEINNFAFILKWNRKVFFGKAKINHLLTNEAKKIKKSQCLHCSEIFTNRSIKSHSQNCQFYAKLIKNGLECSVCLKSFESREAVNRHIGHNHKEALSEIKQKSNLENELSEFCQKPKMNLPNETCAKPGLEISKEQNPGILATEPSAKPDESSKRKGAKSVRKKPTWTTMDMDKYKAMSNLYYGSNALLDSSN